MAELHSLQQGTAASPGHTQGTTFAPPQRAATAQAMQQIVALWATLPRCPVHDFFERVGNTWTLRVVVHLGARPQRFRELLRALPGISQRMLTLTLRGLERDGLVERRVIDAAPPGVEYSLTDLGVSMLGPVQQLGEWALGHDEAIHAARRQFDARTQPQAGRTVHLLTSSLGRARALPNENYS